MTDEKQIDGTTHAEKDANGDIVHKPDVVDTEDATIGGEAVNQVRTLVASADVNSESSPYIDVSLSSGGRYVLEYELRSGGENLQVQFNEDTGSNYEYGRTDNTTQSGQSSIVLFEPSSGDNTVVGEYILAGITNRPALAGSSSTTTNGAWSTVWGEYNALEGLSHITVIESAALTGGEIRLYEVTQV